MWCCFITVSSIPGISRRTLTITFTLVKNNHTRTHTCIHARTHTHTHFLSVSHTHTLSLSHTHTHSRTPPPHTHTQTHTQRYQFKAFSYLAYECLAEFIHLSEHSPHEDGIIHTPLSIRINDLKHLLQHLPNMERQREKKNKFSNRFQTSQKS